jgi:mobilome CxxCx(11)CxxC protein
VENVSSGPNKTGPELTPDEKFRSRCWDSGHQAFGTSYAFKRRADNLRDRRAVVTYVGLAVPGVIGLMALASGLYEKILPFIIPIAVFLLMIQFLVHAWAVVRRWDERYDYALESANSNLTIAEEYYGLAEFFPEDYRTQFEVTKNKDDERTRADQRQGLTVKDERYGMRAMLFHKGKTCTECEVTPKSMDPDDCGVCGNF